MKTLINILLAVLVLSIFSCKKEEVIQRTSDTSESILLKDGESDIVETEDEDEDSDEGIIIVETEDEDEDEDEGIFNTDSSDDDDEIIRDPFGGKKPPAGGRK